MSKALRHDQSQHLYIFGDYCLNPQRRVLLRGNEPVPLTPKAFETLYVLVRRSRHVVSKKELLDEVWPDTFVEEATLSQNIFTLRKALGHCHDGQQFIETVPKYGYYFIPDVKEMFEESSEMIIAEDIEDTDTPVTHETQVNTFEATIPPVEARAASSAQPIGTPRRFSSETGMPPDSSLQGVFKLYPKTLGLASIIVICGLAILFYVRYGAQNALTTQPSASTRQLRISKMTHKGKAMFAGVSPDSKFIAYVAADAGRQSLWLQQIVGTNSIEIVPAEQVIYKGIMFSQDGNSIYYVTYSMNSPIGTLYQVPILGGVPKKVVEDIDSPISFSPHAGQFAFVRMDNAQQEAALMVANADGTGVRKLAGHVRPHFFSFDGLAWSPDGNVIVCPVISEGSPIKMTLVEVRVNDGAERPVTQYQWNLIGQVAWLSDGSRIVLTAWDLSVSPLSNQLWQVSYPSGEVARITSDFNHYEGISLTAKGDAMVSVQTNRAVNFWVAPQGKIENALQITTGTGDNFSEFLGLSWTPDNRLVYGSGASGDIELWIMNADGSNQRQLTIEAKPDFAPSVSSDGRTIVFTSARTGSSHIWKMDIDGGNLRQLTFGVSETWPDISPDGQWVVYSSVDQGIPALWRVSIDGDEPVKLSNAILSLPSISPDGKLIACFYRPTLNSFPQIAIIPFEGGDPVKIFNGQSVASSRTGLNRVGIHWTADGRALTYVNTEAGVTNIWLQALDGGAPKPLTDFKSAEIFRFGWSRDGKLLAFERGVEFDDVVLISNFH